jgi:hypothetical protein
MTTTFKAGIQETEVYVTCMYFKDSRCLLVSDVNETHVRARNMWQQRRVKS